ncbi:class I SAM-dependent methyltransferase, partial [Patescibacteria group bacterium]|nr:class I SAM-dependent methyltransferase [Patescibacteria group bacterium]
MKKSVCPFCKRSNYFIFSAMPGYKLAKCKACDLVWDLTPPSLPEKQYQEDYFINSNSKGGYANYFEGMKINRKTFSERLNKIANATGKEGRLLDIGCALGDCLSEAESLGWKKAEGIDPSEYAIKKARERGLAVKKGTLESLKIKENSFDLILSQDQIEHVSDPVEELIRMNHVLKPGGLLFLVTPDIG